MENHALQLSDAYLGEKRSDEEEALQLVIKMYNIHDSKNCDRKKHRSDAGRDRAALGLHRKKRALQVHLFRVE